MLQFYLKVRFYNLFQPQCGMVGERELLVVVSMVHETITASGVYNGSSVGIPEVVQELMDPVVCEE